MNENPVAQVVLVGFLGILVAFLFMTRVMGGSSEEAPATTADATGAVVPATPGAEPAAGTDPAAAPAATPAQPETVGFTAGPGLPEDVVKAYESGDAVVLLISEKNGIEDKRLREEVAQLESRSDATVFMADSRDIGRYSRIAQGVDLNRTPALVVIKPESGDGGLPVASITYGFRKPESVTQAVRDALYKGKELPYHPG